MATMFSRSFRRSILESPSNLPPTFLPFRARLSTTNQTIESSAIPVPLKDSESNQSHDKAASLRSPAESLTPSKSPSEALPSPKRKLQSRSRLPSNLRTLLPLLRAQGPHYITAHIHGRPYLVTTGDIVRLPFLMPGVEPGDILRLNRATALGSRDYTLRAGILLPQESQLAPPAAGDGAQTGQPKPHQRFKKQKQPYIDPRLFVCRAVVMGTEAEPMRIIEKTKRRQRHVRHVKSKHKYTVLRIKKVEVRSVREIDRLLRRGIKWEDEGRKVAEVEAAVGQEDVLDVDVAEQEGKVEVLEGTEEAEAGRIDDNVSYEGGSGIESQREALTRGSN